MEDRLQDGRDVDSCPHPEEARQRRLEGWTASSRPHGSRRRFAAPHHEGFKTAASGRVFCPLCQSVAIGAVDLAPKSKPESAIPFRSEGRLAIVTDVGTGRGGGGRRFAGAA